MGAMRGRSPGGRPPIHDPERTDQPDGRPGGRDCTLVYMTPDGFVKPASVDESPPVAIKRRNRHSVSSKRC